MAPFTQTEVITTETEDDLPKLVAPQAGPRKYELLYFNIVSLFYIHVAALYGLYLACTVATWKTLIFHYIIFVLADIGITAGAHRLWSHRAFKAKMPLQILLMLMQSIAYQNTVRHWVRDHRVHHRHSDTDADLHNASRGFFYSHIGFMMVRRHPEIIRRGKFIDMSDIDANPVLMFQKKYAVLIILSLCYALPTFIPMYFFGETLNTAWNIALLRHVCNLHVIFFVNSAAHMWGNKPYDKNIKPTQSIILSWLTLGEGFHNYHHTFPWDYRAAELGNDWLNVTTKFIDFFAWIGWAYDLKTVPDDVIQSRKNRTGDGSNMWGIQNVKSLL